MARKATKKQQATPADDDVYEMEAILDYRMHKGEEQFKVKWKGYPLEDCTWEPPTNIFGPSDAQLRQMEKLRLKAQTSPEAGKQRGVKRQWQSDDEDVSSKRGGRCIVSHIGRGPTLASREFEVTLRWENGHEEKQDVQAVRKLFPEELLDYLLSRVRFRDDRQRR